MTKKRRDYLSYLLRLWRANDGEQRVWRASLECSDTHELKGFADLEELFEFLREQTGASAIINDTKRQTSSPFDKDRNVAN